VANEEYKQRQLELQYGFRFKLLDIIGQALNRLIPGATLVLIAGFIYLSIKSLAGQHTFADIGLKVLGDVKISEAIAYVLAGGGITFGLNERKLRRTTVERLTERTIQLEKELDSRRSSSGLTTKGTTRSEDQL
jgi:hypothetical protein